jgi:hypothetical protein
MEYPSARPNKWGAERVLPDGVCGNFLGFIEIDRPTRSWSLANCPLGPFFIGALTLAETYPNWTVASRIILPAAGHYRSEVRGECNDEFSGKA